MSPSAKVILDSVNERGERLTTMEVTFHRFVLAEFNTHRVFSRNSASSRAIPVHKMLERAELDPAWPLVWPAEQKGMQGGEDLHGADLAYAQELFARIHNQTLLNIRSYLAWAGNHPEAPRLHKSLINRLIEPFLWHTVIVSSTEWNNFFLQRCSPLAQPEIKAAADLMKHEYLKSVPRRLRQGDWHTPYIQDDEMDWPVERRQMVSAARCARVSYLTHDGVRDYTEDLELFHRLISARPGHWSPLEHVATPDDGGRWAARGNFKGWAQLRHEFEPRVQNDSFDAE